MAPRARRRCGAAALERKSGARRLVPTRSSQARGAELVERRGVERGGVVHQARRAGRSARRPPPRGRAGAPASRRSPWTTAVEPGRAASRPASRPSGLLAGAVAVHDDARAGRVRGAHDRRPDAPGAARHQNHRSASWCYIPRQSPPPAAERRQRRKCSEIRERSPTAPPAPDAFPGRLLPSPPVARGGRALARAGRAHRQRDRRRRAAGSRSRASWSSRSTRPGFGYYAAGSRKIGAEGDFVTAPEISPDVRALPRHAGAAGPRAHGGRHPGAGTRARACWPPTSTRS